MQNMENGWAIPDVIVRERPGDVSQHLDRQLEIAVKELLPKLESE
ncbi:MAG TPA: hypothetical protein VKA68_10740 [bacterium]|nr:hypothetical protein [bacterium]